MQLIYFNKTFARYLDNKGTEKAEALLSEALFYNDNTKQWENTHAQSGRALIGFKKNQSEFLEKKWILLRKTDGHLIHRGPFSSLDIFNMVTESKIQMKDPIWTEGLGKWVPISQTFTFKELSTLAYEVDMDPADLLSNVMEYRPEMRRVEEENPSPGAPGEVFLILDDKG